MPARNSFAAFHNHDAWVEAVGKPTQVVERTYFAELATHFAANGIARQIPTGVLAKVANAAFVLQMFHERFGMLHHHWKHFTKSWRGRNWFAAKRVDQVAKEPWAP